MSNKVANSDFMCLKCGNILPMWEYMGTQRRKYQRKVLYCPICHTYTKHVELQNADKLIASLSFKDESTLTDDERMIYQLIKKR